MVELDERLRPLVDAANLGSPVVGGDHGLPAAELREILEARSAQSLRLLMGDGPAGVSITTTGHPVSNGENLVRVYTPPGRGPFPVHLYLHGGGFFSNRPAMFDAWCRHLAAGASCIVASVAYRRAPEHRFPTAAEDAYAALLWLAEHAVDVGGDSARITIGGTSSGGNLAAVACLMSRDRGGPPVALQVLEVPVLDLTMSCPSHTELGEGYVLDRRAMEAYVGYYLERSADASDPYASPLLAPDLAGLPPALVMTVECDPLRDEGEAYARRLRAAGVPAEHRRWAGQFHGSVYMEPIIPDLVAAYRTVVVSALRDAHGDG